MVLLSDKKDLTLDVNLPWTESPLFQILLKQTDLDEKTYKLVKHYADYGYVIIDLESDSFNNLADNITRELAPKYQGKPRIQDAWNFNDSVKSLAVYPQVLDLLRILYRREPIPFQTLNFPVGTQQATHSDTIHFHSVPERFMCGVWVALEDIDAYNGPLHYYPGSHKLPCFDYHHLGITGSEQEYPYKYYQEYEKFIASLIQHLNLEKVDITVKKGQALIWSANLLHGGSPILDPNRTRHSQVTHYYFENCLYYTPMFSDPFLKQIYFREIRDIRTNQVVPLVYNQKEYQLQKLLTSNTKDKELINFYSLNQLDNSYGCFDAINHSCKLTQTIYQEQKTIIVEGWAVLREKNRSADKVIVTQGKDRQIIAIVSVDQLREDVVNVFNNSDWLKSGWMAEIPLSKLQLNQIITLQAWAYDSQINQAFLLKNSFELNFKETTF